MTYRDAGDPARRANLDAVLAWLARYPQLSVIVVEQDAAPRLEAPLAHPAARVVFAHNRGAFNKGWGFNIGFRAATTPWLVFADADVILGAALGQALEYLAAGYQAIKPYRRLINLTPAESARVRGGDFDWIPPRDADAAPNREGEGEHIVYAGGLFLIARNAFAAMGGWDERFRGWGGEDDAMSYKLERARVPAIELDTRPALHLDHARPAQGSAAHAHYAANLALLEDYRSYSDAQLVRIAEVQMQLIGQREKYRPAASA